MFELLPNEIQLKCLEKCKHATVMEVAKLNEFYKYFVDKHEPHLKHLHHVRLQILNPMWSANTFEIQLDEYPTKVVIPSRDVTEDCHTILAKKIKPIRSIRILDLSCIQLTDKVLEILENGQLRTISCLKLNAIDENANVENLGAFLKNKQCQEIFITSNNSHSVLRKKELLNQSIMKWFKIAELKEDICLGIQKKDGEIIHFLYSGVKLDEGEYQIRLMERKYTDKLLDNPRPLIKCVVKENTTSERELSDTDHEAQEPKIDN